LAQRRITARICVLCKACGGRYAWKATGDRVLKQFNLSRGDHNRKNSNQKQSTDVGKYLA